MAALSRMKPRDRGTIVQVGSALAYRGIPLQTAYCGAKHAIQGFHEALRCELLHERSNVHVTMVQMPAVNTPQFSWVLSRLPNHAQPVPPIYQPEVAARAVLYAADHPRRREYWVGASTMGTLAANAIAPGLLDRYLGRTGFASQQTKAEAGPGPARQPLGAGRRTRRPRLRQPRHLRPPGQAAQHPAVAEPSPRHRWPPARAAALACVGGLTARLRQGPGVNRLAAGVGAAWGATLLVHAARLELRTRRPTRPPRSRSWRSVCSGRATWPKRRLSGGTAAACAGPSYSPRALHAASMVALAAGSPRYRRAALTSAAMATLLALLTDGDLTPGRSPRMTAGFAPHVLREYAFVADGCRGALIGPRGDIAWLCAPRWDSDAVISALVGGPGIYAVTPTETHVWGGYYEPGQPGLALPLDHDLRLHRVPGGAGLPGRPGHCASCYAGSRPSRAPPRVRVVLDLRAAFGAADLTDVRRDDAGTWSARTGDLNVRWQGAPRPCRNEHGQLVADLVVPAGTQHDLVLEIGQRRPGSAARTGPALVEHSRLLGRRGARTSTGRLGPRDARHAYAVLRGLTTPGGGMVAAATLGLPERAEAGRNYDYRYVWLRDQAYAGLAAAVDEPHPLLDDAVAFASPACSSTATRSHRRTGPTAAPCRRESTLALPGYPGGKVVVGNWVNGQFQLDAMGEVLQLLARAAELDHLDVDGHRAMQTTVDVIATRWQEPEAGIWELSDAWWTQSRLSVVAGLRAAARQLDGPQARRCEVLADAVLAQTSATCLRARRRVATKPRPRRHRRQPPAAARARRASRRGPPHHQDPRGGHAVSSTRDGYVYRFDPDGRPLGEAEGAFLLCGFTMALAQWHQGRRRRRRAGTNGPRQPAGLPACWRRSTTCGSASSEATCRKASCTRCCSRRVSSWPGLRRRVSEGSRPLVIAPRDGRRGCR